MTRSLRSRVLAQAAVLVAVLTAGGLSGCRSLGPEAIRATRTDYNQAMRQTEDEQLLLNLVRLRYRDSPLFLEVGALNTQFTFSGSVESSTALGDGDDVFSLGGRVLAEEKPTVTYSLLSGENFVERMLADVPLETLFLLESSGWSSERIFRTCVQRMNGLRNAPEASGPTPSRVPVFEEFVNATDLLRNLELADMMYAGRIGADGLTLQFHPDAQSMPEYLQLMQALELEPGARSYAVLRAHQTSGSNSIYLFTRSFMGILYFLSHAVDVPADDVQRGFVTLTLDADGEPFDWTRVTQGLLRIRSSNKRPRHAAVSVSYRGSWFYIDDADLDSKSTFLMLGQIFSLQAGNARMAMPMLTLPVGS